MARASTGYDPDRRRIASPRLKRRLVARLAFTGLVVLAAVCLAFGPIGIAVGVALVVGVGAGIYLARRRRRWNPLGQLPEARVER